MCERNDGDVVSVPIAKRGSGDRTRGRTCHFEYMVTSPQISAQLMIMKTHPKNAWRFVLYHLAAKETEPGQRKREREMGNLRSMHQ